MGVKRLIQWFVRQQDSPRSYDMDPAIKALALHAKGFLSELEGMRLYQLAVGGSHFAPCLEIGTYCGKSSIFLGQGCKDVGRHPLFTIDHHKGSEEQQPGQLYFDPDLYDAKEGRVNTLPYLMQNLHKAQLDDWVIPIVGESSRVGSYWRRESLGLVFIDDGHSESSAFSDYHTWSPCLIHGGFLCIHDIFPNPKDGGQAPYHVLQYALNSGLWDHLGQVETLAVLRRR